MTTSDDPWASLVPGGVDARRVDHAGRWDFFWWVADRAEPGLVLRLAPGTIEPMPLPRMRSLDIRYRDIQSGRGLVIVLRDQEQAELFATLCRDIVSAGEAALTTSDALARAIRRTLRWHHLLRGGSGRLLSLEEQRGLVGELDFLARLCELIGERAAIETWKGPEGSAKDFELDACLVEVKARRGAAKPFVQISSEDQLAEVPGTLLYLRVCDVDAAVKPSGLTLTDHVRVLDSRFSKSDLTSYELWESALESSGFSFDDDYSDRRWRVGRIQDYQVIQEFPRIALPLVQGVSAVRYSIALEACQPWLVAHGEIEKQVTGAAA